MPAMLKHTKGSHHRRRESFEPEPTPNDLLKTIHFPKNLKHLGRILPGSKYACESARNMAPIREQLESSESSRRPHLSRQ